MRHNGRPPIALSNLLPSQIDLPVPAASGGVQARTLIACLACGSFQPLKRHMVHPHRWSRLTDREVRAFAYGRKTAPLEKWTAQPRCPGSGQRVIVDVTYSMWRQRLAEAVADAGTRRSSQQFVKPRPPVAPAVHQIARARAEALAASRTAT